jgi:chlorobactene glucosyltransferase
VLEQILNIFALAVMAVWTIGLVWFVLKGRVQPTLGLSDSLETPAEKISIIVPARNEADRVLKESIQSLLSQNYGNFEVIVIDDRSTDDTLGILQSLFQSAPNDRLKIIGGRELPDDWLGKPHALHQGFEAASGEMILTTDADIIFQRDALRTSVAYMKANDIDVLSLVPRLRLETFWEKVFMPVFGWFCLLAMPLERVNDPNRKETIGVGNFFLITRKAMDSIGGFAAVKADVAEDLRLAEIAKEKKLCLRVETAPDLISTRMYSGLSEIWEGFTKNLFSALKFSSIKGFAGALSIFTLGCLPILLAVGFGLSGATVLSAIFTVSYLIQVAIFAMIIRNIEQNPIYSIFIPLGFGLYALILLNSMAKILSGKGVTWKGRDIYEKGGIKPPR